MRTQYRAERAPIDTSDQYAPLTAAEHRAITTLHNLARRWPRSLWLFADGSSLSVMKVAADGEHARWRDGGIDPRYAVTTVDIPADGGEF